MKIKLPCGYVASYNTDKIVPCPNTVFEKYIQPEEIPGFKGGAPQMTRICRFRSFGDPTVMDLSSFTIEEYLKVTDAYKFCLASTDKKKVILV